MMAPQKKKPLPGQHRKVEPLTRKMEAAAPPRPQLEVLQERMNQTATAVQFVHLHGSCRLAHAFLQNLQLLARRRGGLLLPGERLDFTVLAGQRFLFLWCHHLLASD